MERHGRRRLLAGALLTATLGLAGCPDGGTQPVPDNFSYVVVNEVLSVGGATHTWLVELDLQNTDGDGSFFLRFVGPGSCASETAVIFVFAGRDWTDEFNVNCRDQPREVLTLSLRESGFVVSDRDSIPEAPPQ